MTNLKSISLINDEVEMALAASEEEVLLEAPQRKKLFGKIPLPEIKPFPWKSINRKNAVLGACVLLVIIAAYLNMRFSSPAGEEDLTDKALISSAEGEGENEAGNESEESADYFALAMVNRQRVRDEAIDVLKNVSESTDASSEAKNEAIAEMSRLADEISCEVNIENLVRAKGFEECVAVISDGEANVVIKSEGLDAGEVAQIKEIVYLEADIHPDYIKIIEKN